MADPSEEIRRRLAAPPPSREEIVSDFLQTIWVDSGGGGSVRWPSSPGWRTTTAAGTTLTRGTDAIEELLANPPAENRLMELRSRSTQAGRSR